MYLPNFEREEYWLPEVNDPPLRRLVEEHKEKFSVLPGRTDLYEYYIRLLDDVPVRIPPRRLFISQVRFGDFCSGFWIMT